MVTSNTATNTVVDASDPNVYLATNFTLENVSSITINVNTLRAGTTIYLQSSTDGTNWSSVASHVQAAAISLNTDISFNGLTNFNAIYFRFVFVNSSFTTSNGWLGQVTTITYYGTPS